MVLNTQLQLKWPNHSTHLLTGLKALFQNEQLVDCTLKCNKHSLKVHKSVLAACSPYFERKLENNPSIVVKDVQFSILQSLIEFMYYGETRISEDNLTSLIEAAKLFEVKGLSEMDLIPSNENSIILSVVAVNGNGGNRAVVKSSSERMENLVFDSHPLPAQLSTNHKNAQQSESDVSTSSLTLEDTDLPEIIPSDDSHDLIEEDSRHTNRNFVVTPPQTESAQILLSLACPFTQQQTVNGAYNGDTQEEENNRSLLEKLLTRDPASQTQPHYYENYKYAGESSSSSTETTKNQNDTDTIQPEAILEYPFLVQTNEGLVDATEMLNVFDHGGVFDTNSVGKTADKIVPKESVLLTEEVGDTTSKSLVENRELEHIKLSTEEELKNDPGAVVLYKTNEFGQVEQYVLSSSDIIALKAMNEQLKQKRPQNFDQVGSPHIEVEFPASEGNTSLITRIFSNDDKVEKAISKLPFRRTSSNRSTNVESVDSASSSSTSGDRLLDDTPLTVDAHHHENMFEELDSQFIDCSIENIQREYGAYEEASKHESQLQLDHNYYANAMKDGDEECAVVISGDNYDLGSVMLIQEPTEADYNLVALSNNNNNNSSNSNNNIKRKDSAANVAASANFRIFNADGGDVYLNGERTSRCNGVVDKSMFNGKCDLIISNDDLISPVLTTTVMNTTTAATTTSSMARAMNCVPDFAPGVKNSRGAKTKRRNSLNDAVPDGSLTLPFKKVKNAISRNGTAITEKKPCRRTYRRRSTSLNEAPSESRSLNNGFQGFDLEGSDASLVEEVIVDEVLS